MLGQVGIVPRNKVQIELFLTNDSGQSWVGPTVLGENLDKDREHVWLAYSRSGALGAIWRTHTGPCCFGTTDVWSVVSRDGGVTFDPPRRLSYATSPWTDGLGDDYQSVALDDAFLHAAWGDKRAGQLGFQLDVYYGRLPLQ